jgi:hypothetical protein
VVEVDDEDANIVMAAIVSMGDLHEMMWSRRYVQRRGFA